MLKNFFKTAWRNLWKNRTSTIINVIGLSTGLVCFVLIFLFVEHELSYDRFHQHPEQVYRVVKDFVNDDGSTVPDATTPPALSPSVQKDLPEVAHATRIFPNWGRRYLLRIGDKKFNEPNLVRVDSNFFDVFTFPFISGNKQTALLHEKSILITQNAAEKYFGKEDPLGKTINIDLGPGSDYIVTAVLQNVPPNSHFTFDFLIPLKFDDPNFNTSWGWYNFYTYVRLKEGADAKSFERKLQPLVQKNQPDNKNRFYTQKLTNIHLDSRLKWELSTNGDRSYVNIMMAIAIFVLVIAGINYVNLATARSAKRAKEVGIRKVSGAQRSLLIGQFLTESLLIAICSLCLSILLSFALLPVFNRMMDKQLILFSASNINTWLIIIGVTLLVGLMSGIYPAIYLSQFKPIEVLKSTTFRFSKGSFLRKGLVTFQFVISMVMITSILLISQQLNYMRNKKLGFDKENIIIVPNAYPIKNKEAFKTALREIPSIQTVGGADGMLGGQNWTTGVRAKDKREGTLLNFISIDYDFLPTLNVEMKEGRNFSPSYGTDTSGIILNETAVKELGIKLPVIGSQIVWSEEDSVITYATVVGVTKDFHFSNFHEHIKPFGFVLDGVRNPRVNTFFVKTTPGNTDHALSGIENVWKKMSEGRPFEYLFQDEEMNRLSRSESNFRLLFIYLTAIAIIIACLGLFGLATFTAEQRTKEIGIRKVLGATVQGVVGLLSKDFMQLVLLSILIATPLSWYLMRNWLNDFAYRISIEWWVFVIAAIVALLIAMITISFQAIRAALSNPVKSLRTE